MNLSEVIKSTAAGYRLYIEFNGNLTESIVGFYRSEYVDAQNNKRWVDNTNQCFAKHRKIKVNIGDQLESILHSHCEYRNVLLEIIYIPNDNYTYTHVWYCLSVWLCTAGVFKTSL